MLADLNARHVGGDGPEFAANFQRRIRLQIPGILVCWPAPHEEKNAGFGPAKTGRLALWRRRGAPLKQTRNGQSEQTQGTGTQQLATSPSNRVWPAIQIRSH